MKREMVNKNGPICHVSLVYSLTACPATLSLFTLTPAAILRRIPWLMQRRWYRPRVSLVIDEVSVNIGPASSGAGPSSSNKRERRIFIDL